MSFLHASPSYGKEKVMQLNVKAPVLALAAGQILTLDDAEGLRILARSGTVWVTEEGSPDDHIVGPGDTLIVAHPGRTLVQAIDPAWISLAEGDGAANDSH
jgi:uncharacterized protein with PhoU and TrkA domain